MFTSWLGLLASAFRVRGKGESPAAGVPASPAPAPANPAPISPWPRPTPAEYYLTGSEISKVREFRPAYETAADAVGIVPGSTPSARLPWQALAALHYMEARFLSRVKTPGGPFQLDPGGTGDELLRRIRGQVADICGKYNRPIGDIETDFATAVLVAAHHLIGKVRIQPYPDDDLDTILADAFWGYNGRAKFHTATGESAGGPPSWQYSPYVNNHPKAGRSFRVQGTIPDDTVPGGRRRIDRVSTSPGALIIYQELIARDSELAPPVA